MLLLWGMSSTLAEIMPHVETETYPEWLGRFKELDAIEFDKVIDAEINPTKSGLTMGEVIKTINATAKEMIVTDVGQHQMIACLCRVCTVEKQYHFRWFGNNGFALPAALGAKMGAPEREVVAVIGDVISNEYPRVGYNFPNTSCCQNCDSQQRLFGDGSAMATIVF